MDEMTANGPPIKTEKRRGARFPVVVPIEAKWQQASGKSVKQAAKAIEVNAQGGWLELKVYPRIASKLALTTRLRGKALWARTVGTRQPPEGQGLGVRAGVWIPGGICGGGIYW